MDCRVFGVYLGTRCPPAGQLSWVEHNVTAQKAREAVTIDWPFTALWLQLVVGTAIFRLFIFPLFMWVLRTIFERQECWEAVQSRRTAYGVPESEEAVWGGVIGLWHGLTAAGLAYAWHHSSVYWFRCFVLLELIWELDDFLMIIFNKPPLLYGGSRNMYQKASSRITMIMTAHHVLGLLYIPFGFVKFSHNSNVHMLALSLILHGAVGRLVATFQHFINAQNNPGTLAILHGTNLCILVYCRFYLFPLACWSAGREYHMSDSEAGPIIEVVLHFCLIIMFLFNIFICHIAVMRTLQWARMWQANLKDQKAD